MRDPEQAAHALGKLLKHCGEDNVLWGTDSIWYGSPQDQIQAFRTFQISAELRAKHGYAEITPARRAKIFGLSGAKAYGLSAAEVKKGTSRDRVAQEKVAYLERPQPHFRTYGPKTRREFLSFASLFIFPVLLGLPSSRSSRASRRSCCRWGRAGCRDDDARGRTW